MSSFHWMSDEEEEPMVTRANKSASHDLLSLDLCDEFFTFATHRNLADALIKSTGKETYRSIISSTVAFRSAFIFGITCCCLLFLVTIFEFIFGITYNLLHSCFRCFLAISRRLIVFFRGLWIPCACLVTDNIGKP